MDERGRSRWAGMPILTNSDLGHSLQIRMVKKIRFVCIKKVIYDKREAQPDETGTGLKLQTK